MEKDVKKSLVNVYCRLEGVLSSYANLEPDKHADHKRIVKLLYGMFAMKTGVTPATHVEDRIINGGIYALLNTLSEKVNDYWDGDEFVDEFMKSPLAENVNDHCDDYVFATMLWFLLMDGMADKVIAPVIKEIRDNPDDTSWLLGLPVSLLPEDRTCEVNLDGKEE